MVITKCYGLDVCIYPNSYVEVLPTPSYDGISRRWGLWEVVLDGVMGMGSSAWELCPYKKRTQSLLSVSLHQVRLQQEGKHHLQYRKRPLTRNEVNQPKP